MNLPEEFVIGKFYEYGYRVTHSKYNDTYNCACPICREGKSFHKKKRCFYIPKKGLIYCHNCGWSSQPYKWIREVSGMSDKELLNEIKEGDYDTVDLEEKSVHVLEGDIPSLPEDSINLSDPHQVEYYKDSNIVDAAIKIVESRRLFTAINRCKNVYVSLKDKVHRHRLIIPFLDTNSDIIFYQSRRIFKFDKKEKYISKVGGERSVFNIDQVTSDIDDIYIFEGPLDAFFTRNGVAVGGVTEGHNLLSQKQDEQMNKLPFFHRVWVLDSQWLDKTSLKKTRMLLDKGADVFIWPRDLGIRYKDFNEVCSSLELNEIRSSFIRNNTFTSIEGILRLNKIEKSI
jgi:hypothetical protein